MFPLVDGIIGSKGFPASRCLARFHGFFLNYPYTKEGSEGNLGFLLGGSTLFTPPVANIEVYPHYMVV